MIDRFRTRQAALRAAGSVTYDAPSERGEAREFAEGPETGKLEAPQGGVLALADFEIDLQVAPAARPTDLRCTGCGYGVTAAQAPEVCPMCREATWELVPWRPFSQLDDFLHRGAAARARELP
jgi:rubrerythrin